MLALSHAQKESRTQSLLVTHFDDKIVYKLIINLTRIDSLTVVKFLLEYLETRVVSQEPKVAAVELAKILKLIHEQFQANHHRLRNNQLFCAIGTYLYVYLAMLDQMEGQQRVVKIPHVVEIALRNQMSSAYCLE